MKIFFSILISIAVLSLSSKYFFTKVAFAMSPLVVTFPNEITVGQDYAVEAKMSGLSKSAVYWLRLVLFKSGSLDYFGSTWNGSVWYNGTPSINYQNYLAVNTNDGGAWEGEIKGKVELSDPNYIRGLTDYSLKLGLYTEAGSSATWSEPMRVTLLDLASTPAPSLTSTLMPTSILIPSSTFSSQLGEAQSTVAGEVLAAEIPAKNSKPLPMIFLGTGLAIVSGTSLWLWYTHLAKKIHDENSTSTNED